MTKRDDAVYLKNLAMSHHEREIRALRHLKYADWQPEYEARGIEPIIRENVSEDFKMYSRRQQKPKPKTSKPMVEPKDQPGRYAAAPAVASGSNSDLLWPQAVPEPQAPPAPAPPKSEVFTVEDIPSPPPSQFQNEDMEMSFDDVEPGDYCVLVSGKIIGASQSKMEVEDLLNQMVLGDKPIPVDDITILRKIPVGFGANLDD